MKVNYEPFFQTIKEKGISTYKLRTFHNISPAVFTSLKNNRNVNIHTLGILCEILECNIEDVVKIEY